MFYHVLEVTRRSNIPCYRLVKTYKTFLGLRKYLAKEGKPVWIIMTATKKDYYLDTATHLGGTVESYWNTGGFGSAPMPILPYWSGK